MSKSVASGGSSTINGVVYQLLWSLLRVAKVRVSTSAVSEDDAPESFTLVLEPRGGGGDIQVKGGQSLTVEQIKARSGGGTWSLKEVIEDVLPDLFLATAADASVTTSFRFVTEGRLGEWTEVYEEFLRNLKTRPASEDPLSDLDDQDNLTFIRQTTDGKKKKSFFPEPCTELGLFRKIVEVISLRPAVKKLDLDDAELQCRVKYLLSNFEFVGDQIQQDVQRSINTLLLAIVDKQDDIPQIRDHLALELARAATVGGQEIDATTFLSDHGLDATPLSDWAAHLEKARDLVKQVLDRRRYNGRFDIRRTRIPDLPELGRVLILTGDSGTGKSWMLNALAERTNGPLLPVILESIGTADVTLKKCADLFWLEIHDGDEALDISRVAKRLRKYTHDDAAVGLTVLIDGVNKYEEARRLVDQNWQSWSSSLVLVCRREIARSLRAAYPNQIQVYECERFSWEEVHKCLSRRLGPVWPEIPSDIRETLRTPLLAGIYCEELGVDGWQPQSEYELYLRVWDRLSTGVQTDFPLDASCVEGLSRDVRNGGNYPWSMPQLVDAGLNDEALIRLQRVGWITAVGSDRYRIFHDRLLQWAVARSLCSDVRDGNISTHDLVEFVMQHFGDAARQQQVNLGYVPMDILWMLSQFGKDYVDVSVAIVGALENTDHNSCEVLYSELLPTLGECVADTVYERYVSHDGHLWILKRMATCLATVAKHRIEEFARPLLESTDCLQQRRGVGLLRHVACPTLLDRLWKIHIAGQANPNAFGENKDRRWLLYKETFSALKKSAQESPKWLQMTIAQANPADSPVHDLACLVANLNDSGVIWRSVKDQLFEKIGESKPRRLVENIARYRDAGELEWLNRWIGSEVDDVASSALKALSRLAPDAAVRALEKTPNQHLYMGRNRSFAEVFARRPEATHTVLLTQMKDSDDPWDLSSVFQARENDISIDQLDLLLDYLCSTLKGMLANEIDQQRGLFRHLKFLAELAAPEHLATLRRRRGTEFEFALRDYVLRIGPHCDRSNSGIELDPALTVLNLIGGTGLTSVINEFLETAGMYGRNQAIVWAVKRPDETTFARLADILRSEEMWPSTEEEGHPVIQIAAAKALAQHGRWRQATYAIVKWGASASLDFENAEGPIQGAWVDRLREDVRLSPLPGNVLALGTVGCDDDCPQIHAVLDRCDAASELAHACIIALERLSDNSEAGVTRVIPHLDNEKHRYSTVRMLAQAGTPLAWQALFKDLQHNYDIITALNLINLSDHAEDVVDIVLVNIPKRLGIDLNHSRLKLLLKEIQPTGIRDRILGDRRVRELFNQASADAEGGFRIVGAKADAIECMAEFDSDGAFTAASHVLMDANAHDRERYPSLLINIDSGRGVKWLTEHLATEKKDVVRVAICRSLENKVPIPQLLEGMQSKNTIVQIAWIELAGWAEPSESVDKSLVESLEDHSDEVIMAVIKAKHRRRDRKITQELSDVIVAEQDHLERSIYVDALISFADPGDAHRRLPPVIERALKVVPESEWRAAVKRLDDRRKKEFDALKKAKAD